MLVHVQVATTGAAFERRRALVQDPIAVVVSLFEAPPISRRTLRQHPALFDVELHLPGAVVQHQHARAKAQLFGGLNHGQRFFRLAGSEYAAQNDLNWRLGQHAQLGQHRLQDFDGDVIGRDAVDADLHFHQPASLRRLTFFSFSRYAFEIIMTL